MSLSQLDRIESLLKAIAYKIGVKTDSFNPSEYLQYDPVKNLIIEHLECKGYSVYVNPDKYGIDLIAEKDGKKKLFEVEVKNWSFTGKDDFPFPTVHFTKRKKKFNDCIFYYVILNKENTHALISESSLIFKDESIIKKFVSRNGIDMEETFYELKKEHVRFFMLAKKYDAKKK